MTQLAFQRVAAILEFPEQLAKLWMINRAFVFVRNQVLLTDIGDVARLPVFGEQMVERLVFRRPDVFRNGIIPFFAVGKDGIYIKHDPAKRKDAVTHNVPDSEARMGDGRGVRSKDIVV